jgi:2-keto-4-pentenoate hydratase/2-oxohepta-3-ene-1,7-dioic acid hydratase in catechol pathway
MKLATYTTPEDTAPRVGVVTGDGSTLVDLATALTSAGFDPRSANSMQDVIEGGADCLAMIRTAIASFAGEPVPISKATLLAPLPRPVQMRDCMCFEEHLVGSSLAAMRLQGRTEPSERSLKMHEIFKLRPIYYKANRMAVTGPDTDVKWPAYSQLMDYELEMACVIGKAGRHVPRDRAIEIVAGYCVGGDYSVRDWQKASQTMIMGKGFDTHAVFGPAIVTPDEAGDISGAEIRTYVIGELRQTGKPSQMIHDIAAQIEHLTAAFTLEPGDVIYTGTPAGVGAGFDPPKWLKAGDTVRIEIDGLGHVENKVVEETGTFRIG